MIGFQRKDEKGIIEIPSGSHSHQASYAIVFTAVRAKGFLMKRRGTADETAVGSVSDLTAYSLNP
jgi:hypothetical protein